MPTGSGAVAAEKLGNLVFDEMALYGGEGLRTAVAVLFLLATFAGMLGFHNAASRYLFVLGRDRVLPAKLGQLHPRHHSPRYGSLTVTAVATVIVAVLAIAGSTRSSVLAQGATGLATLGIVILQALAAVAIVVFFRRRGQGRYWKTLILPRLGAVGLAVLTVFLLFNFGTVFTDSPLAIALPWTFVAIGDRRASCTGWSCAGASRPGTPGWPRAGCGRRPASSPGRPGGRGGTASSAPVRPGSPWPGGWSRRGCRSTGSSGTTTSAASGTPTGRAVRRTTVAWPSRRSTRRPSRTCPCRPSTPTTRPGGRCATTCATTPRSTGSTTGSRFNTAVTWVQPDGVGWTATTTTGDFRYYSGVIAAPGTAWHPVMPTWPGQECFRGQIWHSARYKVPAELAGKRVLVVGAGNSGAEIACDAARSGAIAYLSMRRGHRLVPAAHQGRADRRGAGRRAAAPGRDCRRTGPDRARGRAHRRSAPPRPAPAGPRRLAGHPTVSDDLLTFIEQGWVHARPDIAELLPGGVRFVDGTAVEVDLIIAATGFERQLPFLAPEVYSGRDGRPDLYLNMFSRSHDGLVILGLSDFAGATFPRFDDMARAVIVDLTLRELGGLTPYGAARRGRLSFARGVVDTPAFMPVGTYGTVKAMTPEELIDTGAQIVLGNTFHLMLRPGTDVIAAHGGLHGFMHWEGPILTDSGGFQVWSLEGLRKLSDDGVRFQSPVDGSPVFLTPERSMEVQRALGADIVMIFDECTPYPATEEEARVSMERSLDWARRSRAAHGDNPAALFGIVQGGMHRASCASARWRACSRSASTATPSAGSRSASRRRSASPCSSRSSMRCHRTVRVM